MWKIPKRLHHDPNNYPQTQRESTIKPKMQTLIFIFYLFQGQKLNNEKTKNALVQQLNKFFYIRGKKVFLQFKIL